MGQDHGRAGRLLRHARTGRGQRHERAPCGPAGFHADGAVRRDAGARARGPRGVPGDRGQATVLLVRQMGRSHPADRTHSRVCEPRLPRGALGASGPGSARAAGGHAVGNRRGDRCQAGSCCIARGEFARRRAVAGPAGKSVATRDDRGWAWLEHGRPEGGRSLRRPVRPAGRAGVPLSGLHRQPASLSCRLRRHRHRSRTGRGHQVGRSPDRGGRTHGGNDDQPV